jgi:hypothetical protein
MVAALALSAFAIPLTAGLVSAHSGDVKASQTCQSWSAEVDLANNVTSDRTVVVTTTIPGTVGIAGGHFNTSFGKIWDASGLGVTSGTVTLMIYNGPKVEFTASATLPTLAACATPTSLTTPRPFESFQGETALPSGTPTVLPTTRPTAEVTPTPFESFQGETATADQGTTPPPTSTGSNGLTNSSTPLFALLICLAFGGLALVAVDAQRRSIRR